MKIYSANAGNIKEKLSISFSYCDTSITLRHCYDQFKGIEKDSLLFLSLRTTAGWECLHPLVIVFEIE